MGPQRPGRPPRGSGPSLDGTLGRFTFGGRMPGGVGIILFTTVVLSVLTALGGHRFAAMFEAMALIPDRVLHGQVWRLLTWSFVEASPFALIFACLALWWFGSDLARVWGSRRFFLVYMAISGIAAVGTCLVTLAFPDLADHLYLGNGPLGTALTVSWGLLYPDRVIRIYFIIPIRGILFAWGTIIITLLAAVYYGLGMTLPYLFAEGAMLAWHFRKPAVLAWRKYQLSRDYDRKQAERKKKAKQRSEQQMASVHVLRTLQAKDDDNEPLDEEAEARLKELFGKGANKKDKNELN